jgi:hypothetical protein
MTKKERDSFAFSSSVIHFLTATYPGYAWSAHTDADNGVLLIIEPTFMESTIPYVIRLPEVLYSEKALRKALVKAGGEILERYCLTREAITVHQANEKIQMIPTDFAGVKKFDAQGAKNWLGKGIG